MSRMLLALRLAVISLAITVTALPPASSEENELAAPKGEPILAIEGDIGVTNADGKALFDRAMVEELGMVEIKTTTPWFDGVVTFEGVPLDRIMDLVKAEGDEVVAIALNDYRTTIPMQDFEEHGAILAIRRDGEYMPVSDKGPLFIVYSYDSDPQLHSQKFYARSVWQLSRLIVR